MLTRALELDPHNLETLQTLASVRLSQEKPDEALHALRTFPPPPLLDSQDSVGTETTTAQEYRAGLLGVLAVPTRIARAKLLLECGAHADALALLEGVVATDDAQVEAWYLMGWAWWLRAERRREGGEPVEGNDEGEWEDMARDARECLETCRMVSAVVELGVGFMFSAATSSAGVSRQAVAGTRAGAGGDVGWTWDPGAQRRGGGGGRRGVGGRR